MAHWSGSLECFHLSYNPTLLWKDSLITFRPWLTSLTGLPKVGSSLHSFSRLPSHYLSCLCWPQFEKWCALFGQCQTIILKRPLSSQMAKDAYPGGTTRFGEVWSETKYRLLFHVNSRNNHGMARNVIHSVPLVVTGHLMDWPPLSGHEQNKNELCHKWR